MAVHYRTQGLVLKKRDLGEADRIFTIFTKNFGKLEILAKAIRKIKSKLRGGMEIFYLSDIEFIQGKTHKTLTDAILIENFKNLKKDLLKLKIAYKIAEISEQLIKGEEKDEKIWQLFSETFQTLNNAPLSIVKCQLLYYYFLWSLLSILGYQPQLSNCILCQKKIEGPLLPGGGRAGWNPENLYFSPKEGGIICNSCSKRIKKESRVGLKPEIVKILRLFLTKDWKITSRLKIEKDWLNSLKEISENYLDEVK